MIYLSSLSGGLTGHADGLVRFADEDTIIGSAAPL